jgi:hypothetical protein
VGTAPFEIIAGPARVYIAPVCEAFPAINATPAGNWTYIGDTEGGVNVSHPQEFQRLTVDQRLLTRKIIRTSAGMIVAFSLAEITLEQYSKFLYGATVTDTPAGPGTAGFRYFNIEPSVDVNTYALLVRGPSPYMDANLQYEIPKAAQTSEPEIAFVKDDKAVLPCEWEVLEDPNNANRFGVLRAQDAAPV